MSKQEKSQANEKLRAYTTVEQNLISLYHMIEKVPITYSLRGDLHAAYENFKNAIEKFEREPSLSDSPKGLGVQPDIEKEFPHLSEPERAAIARSRHKIAHPEERPEVIKYSLGDESLKGCAEEDARNLTLNLTDDSVSGIDPIDWKKTCERISAENKAVWAERHEFQDRIAALEKQLKAANDRYARREQKYYEWPKQRDELKAKVEALEKENAEWRQNADLALAEVESQRVLIEIKNDWKRRFKLVIEDRNKQIDELKVGLEKVWDAINDIPQDCDRTKPIRLIRELLAPKPTST